MEGDEGVQDQSSWKRGSFQVGCEENWRQKNDPGGEVFLTQRSERPCRGVLSGGHTSQESTVFPTSKLQLETTATLTMDSEIKFWADQI